MRHRMELALEYGSVSVNDIARHLGVSRTTISNYLHGRTEPRRGDLIAWAMACGVPFDWLVGVDGGYVEETNEPPPPAVKAARTAKPKPPAKRKHSA